MNIRDIESYEIILKSRLNITDDKHEVFKFISHIIYYNQIKNKVDNNKDNYIDIMSPLIFNVSPNRRTTESILLDIYRKFSTIKDPPFSSEVLPDKSGWFHIG